jgi:hypothetical protein
MKEWYSFWEWLPRCLGLLVAALLLISPVSAAALSQGFKTTETIQAGSLVGIDPASTDTVRITNSERVGELIGVVVASDATLLAVSGTGTNVQVVTNGSVTTLVSNLNGDIKKGDPITASPLNGVGMKATTAGRILGLAQNDFSSTTAGAITKEVDSNDGKKSVQVGGIPVIVAVGYNNDAKANLVPPAVQNITNFIAGKPVSTLRIIIAALLLILGLVLAVIILNSAVKSSMASIGFKRLNQSFVFNVSDFTGYVWISILRDKRMR